MQRTYLMIKSPFLLYIFICLGGLSCSPDSSGKLDEGSALTPPHEELYTTADRQDIIAAARAIIEADPVGALISVDSIGRPRVRSVNTSKPDSTMSIWIATRPGTRKVGQIKGNPNVTLYYNDDQAISYVSIMGTALLHDDLESIVANNPFSEQWTEQFFPDYPEDMLLIEIRPVWMEVMGQGIAASDDTWRPQAVTF